MHYFLSLSDRQQQIILFCGQIQLVVHFPPKGVFFMRNEFLTSKRINPAGYALLLGLLIVVAIGIIIYVKFMYGPVYEIGVGKSDINPPWRQWEKLRIRLKTEPVGKPSAEQNQIAKPLMIEAECKQADSPSGEIKVLFDTDGKIKGAWTGTFRMSKDIEFQVMFCEFKGTIDPKEIYSDSSGPDFSKLFFIAEGSFTILEINNDTGTVRNLMGTSYFRGWLGKNNLVKGELIITADNKNFYRFNFEDLAESNFAIPLSPEEF